MMAIGLRATRLALAGFVTLIVSVGCSPPAPKGTFATPEEAVQAIADLAGSGEYDKAADTFGADVMELLRSGDDAADHEDALKTKELILEKVAFEDVDEARKIALFGNDPWPFPLPLVLEEGRWRFDAEGGREELTNRRVGRNELLALASLHAAVDAQREYFASPPAGQSAAYARKFRSSNGAKDGLYWPVAEGEPESPLGPLLAEAAEEVRNATERRPFHGYYFRMLEAQGKHAPGGERSYLDDKGLMTLGFAVVAWPAKYDNSGVMTFQVSHQGLVFQKDLGDTTETAVETITAYDPDESWAPTPD